MKNTSLMLVLGFFMYCGCEKRMQYVYPEIIISHKLEKVYDLAKLEMYKLNSCCDCKCKAKSIKLNQVIPNDNFSILSLSLSLDTVIIAKDTSTFFFHYYIDALGKSNRFEIIQELNSGCVNNYAIAMDMNLMKPIMCYSDENLIGDYRKEEKLKNLNSQLDSCIKCSKNINTWLWNYYSTQKL